MTAREEELRAGLGRYLSARWNAATTVEAVSRIPGGASRETWRCQAAVGDERRGVIVRIDPETSLIDTDRATEYRAIEAAFRAGLPAPEPLFLEHELSGSAGRSRSPPRSPAASHSPDGIPLAHRESLGRLKWRLLGEIARLDPTAPRAGGR